MAKIAASEAPVALMEQHPVAQQLVPGSMTEEEFKALCDDMKSRGQQLPITTFEGKVLDGFTRYRACIKNGMTPMLKPYTGNDPSGLVIALNVLRRKMGTTQRALAGARLNLEYNVTQEEASRRVGVSKVHINLVVQAIKSKNARVIKLLESGDLTREQLHEELYESGVLKSTSMREGEPPSSLSGAGAMSGLEAAFARAAGSDPGDEDGVFDEDPDELDDILGDPPTAGGKLLSSGTSTKTAGGMPDTGSRPSHPERRAKDTPAYRLAEQFKGLPELERISFIQIAWPILRPLLKAAGVSADPPAGSAAAVADAAIAKAADAAASAKPAKAPGKRVKAAKAAE
jgi:hypothetical protein